MKIDEEKLDGLCDGFKKNVMAGYRTKLDFIIRTTLPMELYLYGARIRKAT